VVGFKHKYKNLTSYHSEIIYATDGLVARTFTEEQKILYYDIIIIDEVHERKLWSDIIIILVKDALRKNQNLKMILMSATMDLEKFQTFFPNALTVNVKNKKLYHVDIIYQPVIKE
jgi:pre-mRNA-splicing factor ATP-dependent RNA helicase DHX15/PRP43